MMWLRAEGICRPSSYLPGDSGSDAASCPSPPHALSAPAEGRLASLPEGEGEGGGRERGRQRGGHALTPRFAAGPSPSPPPRRPTQQGVGTAEPPQARHTHGPQPGTPAGPAPGEHSEDVSEHRVTDLQLCPSQWEKRRAEWRVEEPCARGGEGPPRAGPAWGAPGEQPRPERRLFRSGPQGARLSADSARALEPVCSVCSEGGVRQP